MNHKIKSAYIAFIPKILNSTLLTLATSVLTIFVSGMILPFIGIVLGSEDSQFNIPFVDSLTEKAESLPFSPIINISMLLLILIIIKNALSYFSLKYSSYCQLKFLEKIRQLAVDHLFLLPLTNFQSKKSGDLLVVFNADTTHTAHILEDARVCLRYFCELGFYLYMMTALSTGLTLFSFVSMIVFFLPARWIYKRSEKLGNISRVDAANVTGFGVEMTQGFRLIKERANENYERDRYASILQRFNQTQLDTSVAREINRLSIESLGYVCLLALVIFWHGLSNAENTLSAEKFFGFVFIFYRTIPVLTGTISQTGMFSGRLAGLRNLSKFMNEAESQIQPQGTIPFSMLKTSVDINQVSFQYRKELDAVLKNISFKIEKGKSLAIVGESGSGKSTLLTLLYGFNSPTSGHIAVDGTPLKDIEMKSWRKRIACVTQETFLFNKSIRDNITYGLESFSEENYLMAMEAAGIKDFIETLKEKDATLIGERGVRLSGGQAQRIAIARAIMHQPEILILDEATSSLDSLTEKQVQKALEDLSHSFTTLTIAHRLSTIIKCDKILVLDQGEIIEEGTHEELIQKNGKYANMWKTQANE